ncbi:MAG: hypothetical protein JNM56_39950 [Planctomycetia bacterium]|nr:hypothetical protein [Planctomycetia bacterium]
MSALQVAASTGRTRTLLIVDRVLAADNLAWLQELLPVSTSIHVLHLQDDLATDAYPEHWTPFMPQVRETARDRFLAFLDRVGGHRRVRGLLPLEGGFSVWWTVGPGGDRHPFDEPFVTARACCAIRAALERLQPTEVILHTASTNLGTVVASLVRDAGLTLRLTPGTPKGARRLPSLGAWLLRQGCRVAGYLLRETVGWVRQALTRRRPPSTEVAPCVLLTTEYPRHFDPDGSNWYWRSVRAELSSRYGIACRYVLDPNWVVLQPAGGRAADLERIADAIPVETARLAPWPMARLCWRQCLRLAQFYRLERATTHDQLWKFDGANLACIFGPRLRQGVESALGWERTVAARAAALRHGGRQPLAAVVHCEFYRNGSINIAACERLGIPTLGAQHGVVYPLHLHYTLPAGCAEDSPIPTYFAAYGAFARETVSEIGAYPRERVLLAGAPRFDWLVRNPPRRDECRQRLRLPSEAFVVLVTTQPYPWMIQATRDLIDLLRDVPASRVCIKLWLLDKQRAAYQALADGAAAGAVEVHADGFNDLLGACDVLASATSTTLLEATLLGKPTISLDYSSAGDPYPYVEEGVSVRARDRGELAEALAAVRDGSYRTEEWSRRRAAFLRRHVGAAAEGQATETFVRLLHQFLLAGTVVNGERRRAG